MTEPKDPTSEGVDEDSGLTGMLGRAGAAAMRPVRKVADAGKDVLNDEAERAIDGVMAGPLPEAVGRSVVEHRVVERVVASALETKRAETDNTAPLARRRPGAGRGGRPARAREPRFRADAAGDDLEPADCGSRRPDHAEPILQANDP